MSPPSPCSASGGCTPHAAYAVSVIGLTPQPPTYVSETISCCSSLTQKPLCTRRAFPVVTRSAFLVLALCWTWSLLPSVLPSTSSPTLRLHTCTSPQRSPGLRTSITPAAHTRRYDCFLINFSPVATTGSPVARHGK